MGNVPVEATWRQITALIPVYMNVLMVGCANGWLPNAIYFLLSGEEIHATSSQCALIASFSEFGRIAFAIPCGILADKFGRKTIILSVTILHFFAWIGISLSTSLIIIYIGRFVIGVTTALVNAIALISIGEIASPEIRGRLTSIYQISMNIGGILPSIFSAIFSTYKSLAWGITFFSFLGILSIFSVMETPSFLVSISKYEQAYRHLQFVRPGYQENEVNYEFENLKKYIEEEKICKSQFTWLTFLKSRAIRKPTILGILINFLSPATGGMIIYVYVTAIYPSNEFIPKRYYPLIIQSLKLFISISTPFYVDKFPRRSIFMFGAGSMCLINAFCAILNYFSSRSHTESIFEWMFLFGNVLLILCFSASIQPMNRTIRSEIFPQAVKGFCGSLGVISQALSITLSFQLYNVIKKYFDLYIMYVVLSMNSLALFFVIYLLLPECRGAFLADLQMKFKKESSKSSSTPNFEMANKNNGEVILCDTFKYVQKTQHADTP